MACPFKGYKRNNPGPTVMIRQDNTIVADNNGKHH